MKPQEAELVTEISKLQCMVSELKTGFSGALLELSHIQHGDMYLREEMEENRRSCQKKALHMDALVESLKEELGVMRCQIVQLYKNTQKPQPIGKSSTLKQQRSEPAEAGGAAPPAGLSRGKLLLHCFLQGLKAGLSEGIDARHQVAMQLLHSEWEYVSTLNQLYDKYKTPPVHQMSLEPYQTYQKIVEQLLQRHLLFRNTLQERLSAEHWKSLVGDILVQLIGQNDTAFSEMYLGYTTTLASFLSLEFNRLSDLEETPNIQSGQMETEEMKLLSLLLAPVSRIHSYLSHIQNLLQWTGKEHPDCSLLLGSEKALRSVLSRCHVILDEDVQWEAGAGQKPSANCCTSSQQTGEALPRREEADPKTQRDDQQPSSLTNGAEGCLSLRVECWSCSPVRRKALERGDRALLSQPAHDCSHPCCSLLSPDTPGWGETSDSGQGTFSQPTGKSTTDLEALHINREDCETDPDDTSAFDYSSVTSCSPEGTLCREMIGSISEEEEEDSQVPVLLKPSYSQQPSSEPPRERMVCLRWQIPRLTPHPPLKNTAGPCTDVTPCAIGSYGKRVVSVRKGSPPLHPKSAFRPIWDDPSKQVEKDNRQGFIPVQTPAQPNFHSFNQNRENLRSGVAPQRSSHAAVCKSGLWDDSEDSEGPCSTV
ncbi:uncharacterized protein LOC117531884 [Thalassophryne amazonica]|uniref:uncharacterized protein LOC117531884 n=1 Tax=Thalassophryne amazonica TaxID=390379 RepID=UPI001471ED67|nr:uncharacterized protein LOC117531884 [Thalassophryne amazonica]